MNSGITIIVLAPLFFWFWRGETISLVSDCIAEGIRKSKEQRK